MGTSGAELKASSTRRYWKPLELEKRTRELEPLTVTARGEAVRTLGRSGMAGRGERTERGDEGIRSKEHGNAAA